MKKAAISSASTASCQARFAADRHRKKRTTDVLFA
jgi:hypothetical protein